MRCRPLAEHPESKPRGSFPQSGSFGAYSWRFKPHSRRQGNRAVCLQIWLFSRRLWGKMPLFVIFYPPPPYNFCRHCLILQPGCIVNAAHTCAIVALCASENAPPFGILPAPALRPPRWRECGKGEWRGGAGSVCKRKRKQQHY